MRPLRCPQCGGQIDEYPPGAAFAVCEYCSTRFLIEDNKMPRRVPEPVAAPELSTSIDLPPFVRILGISLALVAGLLVIGVLLIAGTRNKSSSVTPTGFRTSSTPTPRPTATPEKPLLQFGSQGENAGEFADACAIAVDKQGGIYVADNKLRVQQFDSSGTFVRGIELPAKGRNYERARTVDKIAIGADGKLYAAIGGVILIYGADWKNTQRVVHVAPDYVQDFALKEDGSMLAVSEDDHIETLLFINKAGGVTRRMRGFHTDAIRAQISPLETAAESVRIATGSDGSIYSIYALGALGSYSLSIGDNDLKIAKFSPAGKFVKTFAGSQNSHGIFVDANGGIVVSENNSVNAYVEDGTLTATIKPVSSLIGFTTDGYGNIYTLADNKVSLWRLQ